MNNQELLAKIEEWVDENELYIDGYLEPEYDGYAGIHVEGMMVESASLITFIKKLLHE